jgi:hypothetical protein
LSTASAVDRVLALWSEPAYAQDISSICVFVSAMMSSIGSSP